jgi:hypothetical protein
MFLMALANNPGNELVAGLFLGVFIIGFIWLCCAFAKHNAEGVHEHYHDGFNHTTKKAIRLAGVDGERISADGQWVKKIKSIWRTDYDKFSRKRRYFVLHLDELKPAKIYPVTEDKAKEWIEKNIEDEDYARKLIRDFFTVPVEAEAVEHHH